MAFTTVIKRQLDLKQHPLILLTAPWSSWWEDMRPLSKLKQEQGLVDTTTTQFLTTTYLTIRTIIIYHLKIMSTKNINTSMS